MTAPLEIFGRDRELCRIDAFLGAVAHHRATLVLEGEPGIGKSSLWRAGVAQARERGFRVLEARPAVAEAGLSLAVLGDLLSGLEEIGRLPGPQRRALRIALVLEEPDGEPPAENAIAVATLALLREVAGAAPLLVAVDDLQCLDPASARVLGFALRRLEGERVGLLATARAGDAESVGELSDDERIALEGLPLPALDRIVRARLGAGLPRPLLVQLEQISGGNPFYALELAANLIRSGRPLEPGALLPVPRRLRGLVDERLETLTPTARRVALATAALSQPTRSILLRAVRNGTEAIDEASAAGILIQEGETVRFAHPLLASVLYEDTPARERRNIHRRLARLVLDPEERARHLAEAADGPNEAVACAIEAASHAVAARGLPDAAAQLARRAAELTPSDNRPEAHRRRLVWASYVLAAGDPRHAESLLKKQFELAADGKERAEAALQLAKTSFATDGISAARTWLETGLQLAEEADDVELCALGLVELAGLDEEEMRFDSGTFERAVALAETVGKPPLLARALGLYAAKLDFQGVTPSEEYWRRALALEASTGELRIDGPTNARGGVLAFLEDDRDAGKALMEAVADSMRRRSDPLLPIQLHRIANVARNAGAWDEADRYIEEASELVAQTGLDSYVPSLLIDAGRMAMLRGDFERARSTIEDGLRLLEKLRSDTPGAAGEGAAEEALAHSVVARMLLQSGQYAEAHAELAHVLDHIRERTYTFPLPEPLADDVICLTALGRLDEAEGELDELYGLADTLARPWWDALAARGGAVVATARGETAAALAEFQRAVELLESMRSPWPYELGRTLFMQGAAQRRARQKVAARATLQRALEIFEGLGANLWVEKTHTELRQIGGRLSRPDALTESERQIAELVALGRSNAAVARELSLSPKTVEWNLSKIYRKLHVRSRTELAARLARRTVSA